VINMKGEPLELFYIDKLASELGRTPQTIRKWEVSGILPNPIFKDKHNRRLYSLEQIEVIVECAVKSNVRQGYSVANTLFSRRVFKGLEEVNKKYV
ncbi:MAG: MerR family transcriptional regulator, partial [Peptostreptococcaceae bacterium]